MTRLVEAVQALGVEADFAPSRRLVKIKGERRTVYVAEAAWGAQYSTWCDDPQARTVELYSTARSDTRGAAAASRLGKEQEN